MLFCEDTSDEMERGLLERLEMDRGFFVSLGSPPTGLPGRGEEHNKRTTAVQQRNHYLVTTQSVGRGRRLMQGRKGAPWRSWVPRRARKVEPRCLGSPPMRGRKDPERKHQALFPVIVRDGHLVWGGKRLQRGRG